MTEQQLLVLTAALGTFIFAPPIVGQTHFQTLYTFGALPDAADPNGVIAVNGALYGMSAWGGTYNWGTVFELHPPSAAGERGPRP